MRYFATLGDRQHTIDVESLGGARYRVRIDDGPAREVDAERAEGQALNLLLDHRSYDVDLEEDGDALNVLVMDEQFRLEVLDERRVRLREARGQFTVAGPQVVCAPMPGKVVKILVEPGAEVAEGDGVIVIEAMKMENELRAPKAGKISGILVTEGQTVEGRAELVRIE